MKEIKNILNSYYLYIIIGIILVIWSLSYCFDDNQPINITIVSGYWKVPNKHNNLFDNWFKNTLNIDEKYVIYTNNENLNLLKDNRSKFQNKTIFKIKDISEFYTYKLNIQNKVNARHVPSKMLGLIWLEKINLMNETSMENPYNSEWFGWFDSGLSSIRNREINDPLSFSDKKWINKLDKNKINYTSSENDIVTDDWYDYKHDVAGGIFIIHESKTQFYRDKFYNYLIKCLKNCDDYTCYSDQIIFSKLKLNHPEYFNKLCDGYGCVVELS
tara:strand:- start:3494 stop:4309 length:816 start_codon:yes stop_codon:yes gene_type:complete